MNKTFPPTALETPDCPPHLIHIGGDGIGRCSKCPAVIEYNKLQKRPRRGASFPEACRRGGRKNRRQPE